MFCAKLKHCSLIGQLNFYLCLLAVFGIHLSKLNSTCIYVVLMAAFVKFLFCFKLALMFPKIPRVYKCNVLAKF